MAAESGCDLCCVQTTSGHSARIFRRLGFDLVGEIAWRDFSVDSGCGVHVPFKNVEFDAVQAFAKKLI